MKDLKVLCGCGEILTDSVALLFSVPGVTQQFVGAFLPDTSGTIIPLQQEYKDPYFLISYLSLFFLFKAVNFLLVLMSY